MPITSKIVVIEPDRSVVHRPLTRRAVLVGGVAGVVLGACSSKSSENTTSEGSATGRATAALAPLFSQNGYITAGVPQRIAFQVIHMDSAEDATPPDLLEITITGPSGAPSVTAVEAHGRELAPAPTYYPISFTPAAAGEYTASAEVDGHRIESVFAVGAEGSSDTPGPGDPLPPMATPTVENPRGVDPICTQDPRCDLHEVSLDDALGHDTPVAYLVATPKFCQIGSCGPVLEVLEVVTAEFADEITFIHQEVYQSGAEAAEHGANAEVAEPVRQLHLVAEPVLYITGRDGVVRYRLDTVYDRAELRAALEDVLA